MKIHDVLKTLFFYMFRIDCEHNDTNEANIKEFMKKHEDCKYYIFSREHKKDGTPHYQGCCFLKHKCETSRQRQAYANIKTKPWVKNPNGSNTVAFSVAKKRDSITAYSNNKEHNGYITNMPEDLRKSLPEWILYKQFMEQVKKDKRKKEDLQFKEILQSKMNQEKIDKENEEPKYCFPYDYYKLLANISYDVYEKPLPMRSLILLSKNIIDRESFLELLYRELQNPMKFK